jgi:hypothetical protein
MSIWFFGFIGVILAATFYAGMNTKKLFYHGPKYGETGWKVCENKVEPYKVADYMLLTLGFSITWPLSLPVIGIYMLGQKFNREK